ncbi:MAG: long-chain fatty acid--CoA ligase [Bacillota bacterium]|jgi:fatty-acyl-CoA synthase
MMQYNLQLKGILERARHTFPKKEIVSRDYSGIFRYNYGEMYKRVCKLANVLEKLGVQKGDRVGALAWNNHRHLELYFAVPCTGAILHTLNLRLFIDQLIYVINHAEDKVIFVDQDLLPLIEGIKDKLTATKCFVIMGDSPEMPKTSLEQVYYYEQLLAEAGDSYDFPDLDEETKAAMCYTTATTGNPKGVMYTHRSIVLHSWASSMVDTLCVSESDTIMPIVPMFHVNAWGLPFTASWVGARQVFPGARFDAQILCELLQNEKVTITAGVPTIWMMVYAQLTKEDYDLSSLKMIVNGGSALPRNLLEAYYQKIGVLITHAYGMTETTPLVTCCKLKEYMADWSMEDKINIMLKQGLVVSGLDARIIGDDGNDVPRDGKSMGELVLKGPWITDGYYKEPERTKEVFTPDGWFKTNDIATIDEEGYVQICDRAKDLIKSGGEWISSVDLENTIMSHPGVAEAAVIAMPHEKWDERPMAIVVLKPDFKDQVTAQDILDFLSARVAKLWMPDVVNFIDEIPKTSVGKFNKKALRSQFTGV